MSETAQKASIDNDRQVKRREAIRRLAAAAAVPAVIATVAGNPRPARAER